MARTTMNLNQARKIKESCLQNLPNAQFQNTSNLQQPYLNPSEPRLIPLYRFLTGMEEIRTLFIGGLR